MKIFYILIETTQMYSLAVLIKYFLKENDKSYGWLSNSIYKMNNNFLFYNTLLVTII